MAHEHERSAARRCAAQMLYSGEIRNKPATALLRDSEFDCLEVSISDYTLTLIEGIESCKSDLDKRLSDASDNWKVERMPLMDLNILRIALYEMLYLDQIPISVSINEAVELAKCFGGEEESPRFVNGLLGNIARQLEAESAPGTDDVEDNGEVGLENTI